MISMDRNKLREANQKAYKGIVNMLPVLAGVLLLVSMVSVLVPKSFYQSLFSGNIFRDSLTGSILGSILTGNPVTAYILGNGFLSNGVSLIAVTAFIAAWTTVGIVQLPAEALMLGRKFAISRNISAFIISIFVAIVTILLMRVI